MKRQTDAIRILIILTVAAFLFSGCQSVFSLLQSTDRGKPDNSQTGPVKNQDHSTYTSKGSQTIAYFSTVSSLILYDDYSDPANILRFEAVWEEVLDILEEIQNAVSLSVPSSDLTRFNALPVGESLKISPVTAEICKIAKDAYIATDGLFDPTIYPLVDLWGFTPRFNTNQYTPERPFDRVRIDSKFSLPDSRYIEAFTKLVDFGKIRLSGDAQSGYTLTKLIQPVTVDGISYQAQLDFGGIAKGYAVDRVTRLLQDRGYAYGSFSCGGSSIALLKNASKRSVENGTYRFALGLRKPRNSVSTEDIYMSVATKDVRLSSSGDYDHSYVVDGVIYSHIINPRTGYPMNTPVSGKQKGLAVLTLLGENAGYADAVTTALCVMGFENALRFINEHSNIGQMIMVLYNTENTYYEVVTNIPELEFEILDSAYRFACHLDADRKILYDGTLLK